MSETIRNRMLTFARSIQMARYEVTFTRDVIQYGTLLVEAESSEKAIEAARRISLEEVARDVSWEDDTAGAPYAIAASDEPQ